MALNSIVSDPAADSYISLDEAKDLAASVGMKSWGSKTDDELEVALRRACTEINAHRFHNPEPAVAGQALSFPRKSDLGGVPMLVRLAQVYQADWLLINGEADRKQWEGAKASPLNDAGVGSPLCPRAFAMLAKLISRVGSFKD